MRSLLFLVIAFGLGVVCVLIGVGIDIFGAHMTDMPWLSSLAHRAETCYAAYDGRLHPITCVQFEKRLLYCNAAGWFLGIGLWLIGMAVGLRLIYHIYRSAPGGTLPKNKVTVVLIGVLCALAMAYLVTGTAVRMAIGVTLISRGASSENGEYYISLGRENLPIAKSQYTTYQGARNSMISLWFFSLLWWAILFIWFIIDKIRHHGSVAAKA